MILRAIFSLVVIFALVALLVIPKNSFKLALTKGIQTQTQVNTPSIINPVAKPVANFQNAPELTAKSAIVIDAANGMSLFEKDPDIRLLPASTTKLMTALVALEKCIPETQVKVEKVEKEGSQMGLEEGDEITVENLLYGLLINSGNDAAYTLANTCSDSYNNFVVSMNAKAHELGMTNTHFLNPAGFDSQFQYSTARDLAKLAKVAVANPLISKIVATKSTVVTDVSGNKPYYLENVNKLLGVVDGIQGIKTGQTEGSLEILVTKTTRHTNTIVAAVLGSHDRFGESQKLIEWAFKNYQWSISN